jgi:hypothetical protein
LEKRVSQEEVKRAKQEEIKRYQHLGMKKLDFTKLRNEFLPETKMHKMFTDEKIIVNLKNKYQIGDLLHPNDEYKSKKEMFKDLYS